MPPGQKAPTPRRGPVRTPAARGCRAGKITPVGAMHSVLTASNPRGIPSSPGGVVSRSTATRLGPDALAAVLETLPDGVLVLDADCAIDYVNPAGAALVGRHAAELTGRSLRGALPGASGTSLHTFLLHACNTGAPVSCQGFSPPAGRWLTVTAVLVCDRLQVSFRETTDRPNERIGQAGRTEDDPVDDAADRDRLHYLAESTATMTADPEIGASANALAELAAR